MPGKVLIALGDPSQLNEAVEGLLGAGYEVVATPDGGDAFARFFEEEPDLVICSAALPVLDGRSFARMICSQAPSIPASDEMLLEPDGDRHEDPDEQDSP